jgi:hypothetical protein
VAVSEGSVSFFKEEDGCGEWADGKQRQHMGELG